MQVFVFNHFLVGSHAWTLPTRIRRSRAGSDPTIKWALFKPALAVRVDLENYASLKGMRIVLVSIKDTFESSIDQDIVQRLGNSTLIMMRRY